jgi:hypothetical protein
MTNATASRIASLAAAVAITASLVFGVTGVAQASVRTAAVSVATAPVVAQQA